jgi:outer membrane immunogenic protein
MNRFLLGSLALIAVVVDSAAAADLGPAPSPVFTMASGAEPPYDWTGIYFGGHASYRWTHSEGETTDTANGYLFAPGSTDTSGAHGGGQIGFDYMFPSRFVLGIVADISSGARHANTNAFPLQTSQTVSDTNVTGAVRARAGYAFDKLLLYGTGGWAWSSGSGTRTQISGTVGNATPGTVETTSISRDNVWTVGAGIGYAFARNWDVFAEYRYSGGPGINVTYPIAQLSTAVSSTSNVIEVGVNWHFGR